MELVMLLAAFVTVIGVIWLLTDTSYEKLRVCARCQGLTFQDLCDACTMKHRIETGYYGERVKLEYERHTRRIDPENPPEPFGRTVEYKPPQVIGTIDMGTDEHWEHLHPKKK